MDGESDSAMDKIPSFEVRQAPSGNDTTRHSPPPYLTVSFSLLHVLFYPSLITLLSLPCFALRPTHLHCPLSLLQLPTALMQNSIVAPRWLFQVIFSECLLSHVDWGTTRGCLSMTLCFLLASTGRGFRIFSRLFPGEPGVEEDRMATLNNEPSSRSSGISYPTRAPSSSRMMY